MHRTDKTARVAGLLYLLSGIPAGFSLQYVPPDPNLAWKSNRDPKQSAFACLAELFAGLRRMSRLCSQARTHFGPQALPRT